MNYRHAFHAGNFADVLKHAVLAYCANYLGRKAAPFAAIDTHAGTGWYDLGGDAARRSPEWRDGIGRLLDVEPPAPAAAFLAPYLDAVRALNAGGPLARYPGSPLILAELARPQDRIVLSELHPEDARTLALRLEGDPRARVLAAQDGYAALVSFAPPKERRGLALVDPPFEERDEMIRMAKAAKAALVRWATGTYIFWRPLKDFPGVDSFDAGLGAWLVGERGELSEKLLRADLWVRALSPEGPLAGAGVVVVNPPQGLAEGLAATLPWLAATLAQGEGAGWRLDRMEALR
jgi:23S rRNA (adenine2030-N6)-methyltransferase